MRRPFFLVVPTGDTSSWDKRNYQAQLGIAPLNSDANEAWLVSMIQFGDDGIPIAPNVSPSRDGKLTWSYRDTVGEISATRPGDMKGKAYRADDLGDYVRWQNEARYGFIDRGAHSAEFALRQTLTKETYADNAEMRQARSSEPNGLPGCG